MPLGGPSWEGVQSESKSEDLPETIRVFISIACEEKAMKVVSFDSSIIYVVGFVLSFSCLTTKGQAKQDSISVHSLRTVEVSAPSFRAKSRTTAPLQIFQERDLEKLNALQVSDAAKFFSGVQIKDYGGIGGLKTVSIRSLGANYTGIFYDGAPVSNYQTGQTDIGRFSLENIEQLSLQIGAADDLFQTARQQALAGALSFSRKQALKNTDRSRRVIASLQTGSWGLLCPSFTYEQSINETFTADVSGGWMQTEGDYSYRSGSGEEKKRLHSDVEMLNLEANVSGTFSRGGRLDVKLYGYDSDRSLPGPDVYYVRSLGEAAQEKQTFSQVSYRQRLTPRLRFRAVAKFDFSKSNYTDYDAAYPNGEKSYHYKQKEGYVGTVFLYDLHPRWAVSWANDGAYTSFRNDFSGVDPDRTIWQSALSLKYTIPRITVTGSLLSDLSKDTRTKLTGSEQDNTHRLSPYLGFSLQPFSGYPLRFRAFYKQTFRQTALGDVYFLPVAPPELKPETARQYNLGFTWVQAVSSWMPYLSFSVDAYRNKIDDKIWTVPKSSLYVWSVQNIDVDIRGIDVQAAVQMQAGNDFTWQIGGNYTYQQVLDVTLPGGDLYKQQMMYAPEHTASGFLQLEMPWVNLNYTLLYSGSRYFERINRKEYEMDPYIDQSLSLSKQITVSGLRCKVSAECLNLFDHRYEVVRSYPMPGRSFRFGVKFVY